MNRKIIKVGITGQAGFIGNHLYNTLGLYPDKYERIPFQDAFFNRKQDLEHFVSEAEVIVHLAAVNRHHNPDYIYNTNISLVKSLIEALESTGSHAHLIYSSSIQEDADNIYGKSKKAGRELLFNWAEKEGSTFTGYVFPNIFGPFGNPYYNSFIATFSHQLTHNEKTNIDVDKDVPLLYVSEVVDTILESIDSRTSNNRLYVPPSVIRSVSAVLDQLRMYYNLYVEQGIIPELKDAFDLNLFNTFRSYIDIEKNNPVLYVKNEDSRGKFVETLKASEGGQCSFSTTRPGITRGDHYHIRKFERFSVIKGEAIIRLRRVGSRDIHSFKLSGDQPAYVDMPVWYTHNISNVGSEDLYTLFWINEFYNPDDSDTYFERVVLSNSER